jgi:co-chaperonin GroES (HSP10)
MNVERRTMKLKAIKNKLIIKLLKNKEFTKVGIFLTATDKTALTKALVLAAGPETQDVQVGDTILPNWNAAEQTKFEKETYYIISEDEVVGVFDDEVNDETDLAAETEMEDEFLTNLRFNPSAIRNG